MNDRIGRQLTDQKSRGVDDLRIDRVPAQRGPGEAPGRADALGNRRKDGFGAFDGGHYVLGVSVLTGLQT